MSELSDRMNLIKTTLAAALPARVVTRDFLDFAERKDSDLTAGVYTLLSGGEWGYENLNGRLAMDGAQKISLIGQFKLAEKSLPSVIEDAEFAMIEEIKIFLRTLPTMINRLQMTSFKQSQQMDAPYGWVAIDLVFIK